MCLIQPKATIGRKTIFKGLGIKFSETNLSLEIYYFLFFPVTKQQKQKSARTTNELIR